VPLPLCAYLATTGHEEILLIYSARRRRIFDFDIWLLFAGGQKVAPGRKASKHTPGVNSGSKKTLPL